MICCVGWGSRTKKSPIADERRKPHVRRARHAWFRWRRPAIARQPQQVVFIDGTSVKTNMTRQRGRCLRGKRLNMSAPFGAWGPQTFIAGLAHDSIIAPWVTKGAMDGQRAMNGKAFAAYIHVVPSPETQPQFVVICSVLATRKNIKAAAAMPAHECWFCTRHPAVRTSLRSGSHSQS